MAVCGSIIVVLFFGFIVLVIWNEGSKEKKFMEEYGLKRTKK